MAPRVGVSNRRRLKRVLIEQDIIDNFKKLEESLNAVEIAMKEHDNLNPVIPMNFGKINIIYQDLSKQLRVFE